MKGKARQRNMFGALFVVGFFRPPLQGFDVKTTLTQGSVRFAHSTLGWRLDRPYGPDAHSFQPNIRCLCRLGGPVGLNDPDHIA